MGDEITKEEIITNVYLDLIEKIQRVQESPAKARLTMPSLRGTFKPGRGFTVRAPGLFDVD